MGKKVWIVNIILVSILIGSAFTVQGTNFRAVCVGISDYPGTGDDLPDNCIHDAQDMKNYLVWYQNWSNSNIKLSINSDATESHIKAYIGNMPNSTGNSELFFYSGHGNAEGLYTYSGTLSPSELESYFGGSFNQFCAFLDACNSGIFVNQMSKGEISSACRSDELSYCGGPDDNSVYSYYVLEGIKNNRADPTSGHVVSAKEVHEYAAPKVTQYEPRMHPKFEGNLGVLNLKQLGPTTLGTLIDDELWDQNVTLIGNVIVPDGKTLAIYNRTVNLDDHYIRCQSSGKIINSGGMVTGYKHYAKSGSYYKGFFPSSTAIQQMINWASSGWDIYVGSGTYTENLTNENRRRYHRRGGGFYHPEW